MVFSYALNSKSLDDWMIVARTTVDVSCSSTKPVSGHVQLSALKVSNSTSFSVDCTSSQDGSSSVEVTAFLRVSGNVPLWWPVGYGSPALFDVTLNLHVENSFSPVDTLTKRTGLKHVELDTSAAPGGSLFRFVVNNVPVFARGANYVPADAFQSPQRINATFLSDILDAAVQANMNMIRIWGGGIFEDDALYDGADERGIMVWEEFKFACALVPRSPAFLESIRREVNDQLTRLAHHASIVVYGGNNENQLTLDWTVDAQDNKKLYDTDYNVLYADVLVPLVFSLDHSRPFWPSSPSNGFLVNDPENNFVVLAYGNGNNASQGDVHFYTYGSDCTDVSIFPQPRFASEFGFQSYPSVESWAEVSQPADLYLFSPLMDHRQHHPDGNQQLVTAISVLFPFQNDTAFGSFVYLSQLLQGICMRSESEHYRRLRGDPNIQTAGTLYWQLNNNWQAPSWSTLEYGNSWKLAHYFARRFYAPVLVSPVVRWTKAVAPQPTVAHLRHAATTSRQSSRDVTVDSVFDVWIVNDGMSDLTDASLSIVTYSWLGKKLHNFTMPLSTIPSGTSKMVWSKDTLVALLDFGCLIGVQCFSEVYLSTAKDGLVSRNSQLFASPKLLAGELSAPKLSAVVQSCPNSRECIVMVRNEPSSGVALWPALRHDGLRGWLSDNVMPTLLPGESAEVTFFSAQDINKSSLQAALSVQSLWDHL
jgi:beta-mannosidase